MESLLDKINRYLSGLYDVFEVDYIKGERVTPLFLRNHLTDYGLIIMVAHGLKYSQMNKTFILTGMKFTGNGDEVVGDGYDGKYWKEHKIAILKDSRHENQLFWALPPEYFSAINGQFEENSIMILVTCNGLTYDNNIGDVLLDKGLGALIGFKDDEVWYNVAYDAFNTLLRLFVNPANYEIWSCPQNECQELSLKEAFKMYNKSPYKANKVDKDGVFIKKLECNMILKSNKDDVAIFSTISEAEEVNLGLVSNFAPHNLGANSPEQSGNFYDLYNDGDYILNGYITGSKYDPAKKSMGSKWYTPTAVEYSELISHCAIDYNFKYKGVQGTRLLGPSGESIFLPYPGAKVGTKTIGANVFACYPCGDVSRPEEYDPNQYLWNSQTTVFMHFVDSKAKVYNYSDEIMDFPLNKFETQFTYDRFRVSVRVDIDLKEITLTDTDMLQISTRNVIRPATRNKFFAQSWERYDKGVDKSLKRTKRVTLDDIKKTAQLRWPGYKVVVK